MESNINELLASSIQCFLANSDRFGQNGIQLQINVTADDEKVFRMFKAENITLTTFSTDVLESGVPRICRTCKKGYHCMDHRLQLVLHVKDDGEECVACLDDRSNQFGRASQETDGIRSSRQHSKPDRKLRAAKVVLERIDDDIAVKSPPPPPPAQPQPQPPPPVGECTKLDPDTSASPLVSCPVFLNEISSPLRRSSRSTKSRFRRRNPNTETVIVKTVEEPASKKHKGLVKEASRQRSLVNKQARISADVTAKEIKSEHEEILSEYSDDDDDDDDNDPDFVLDNKTKDGDDDSNTEEQTDVDVQTIVYVKVQTKVCVGEGEVTDMTTITKQSRQIPVEISPRREIQIMVMEKDLTSEGKQKGMRVQRDVVDSREVEDDAGKEKINAEADPVVESKPEVPSTNDSVNYVRVSPPTAIASAQRVEQYSCDICNKAFSLKRYYLRHLQKTSTDPVLCDICGGKFHTQKDVDQHKLAHIGANPFMCNICLRSFRTLKDANKHVLSHLPHHERPYICEKCGKGFVEQHSLQEHMHIHAENKPYQCQYCDAKYAVRFLLNAHMKCHSINTYRCYTCDHIYKTFYTLKEHLAIYKDHYTKDEALPTEKVARLPKPLKAEKARKRKSFQEMKIEAAIKSEKSKAGIESNDCDESTPVDEPLSTDGLDSALINAFNKECLDLISCEDGDNSQSNSLSLGNDDEEKDNEQNDPQLEVAGQTSTTIGKKCTKGVHQKHGCRICFHVFVQRSQLTRHYVRYGKVAYPCIKCKAKFHSKANRKQHKLLHDGTHKYECKICFRSFHCLSRCRQHTSTHLPMHSRPFPCKQCGKVYSSNSLLKSHMWVHNKKDSLKCGECGRLFRTSYRLKIHMNVHKGTTFRCGSCDRGYTYESSLREHLKVTQHVSEDAKMKPKSSSEVDKDLDSAEGVVHDCNICHLTFQSSSGLARHAGKHRRSAEQQIRTEELRKFAFDKSVERVESQKERMKKYDMKKQHNHYQCKHCGHIFKRMDSLRRHEIQKHSTPKFVCSVCGKGFFASLALKRHMVMHISLKTFQCTVCYKTFYYELGLKKHMERHDDSKLVHICDLCGKGFQFQCWLKEHMLKHTGERPFTCEKCGKGFTIKSIFNKHKQSHEPKTHECRYCGKMYTYKTSLDIHMQIHSEGNTDLLCETCGKAFCSKNGLKQHELTHKGEKEFSCNISGCGSTFFRRSELKGHKRSHSNVRPFRCQTCQKSFKTNFYLRKHMKIHDHKPELPCKVCGMIFYLKNQLKSHMLCHQGEKHLPCSKCNELFITRTDLKKHMKKHLTIFECADCQKVFNMKARLMSHMKVHQGPNRVQCPRCNIFFKDLEYLNNTHLQMCSNDKFCSTCGRKFQSQQNLQSHMGVHTGKRPHECGQCGRAFETPNKLDSHQKLHCKSFPCSKCNRVFQNKANLTKHGRTHQILRAAKKKKKKMADEESAFPLIRSLQLVQQYQEEQKRKEALAAATASIMVEEEVGLYSVPGNDELQYVDVEVQYSDASVDAEVQPVIELDPSCLIHESALPQVCSEQVIVTTIHEDASLQLQEDNQIIMVAMVPDGL